MNKFIKKYTYLEELNTEFIYSIFLDEYNEELLYSLYYVNHDTSASEELLFEVSKNEFYSKVDGIIKEFLLNEIVERVESELEELDLTDIKVKQTSNGVMVESIEFKLNKDSCWMYEDLLEQLLNYVKYEDSYRKTMEVIQSTNK